MDLDNSMIQGEGGDIKTPVTEKNLLHKVPILTAW